MLERTGDSGGREERIAEVLGGYLEAAERGEAPTPGVLIERYPEIAAELAAFFAQQKEFALLMAPLRVAVVAALQTESTQSGEAGGLAPALEITPVDFERTAGSDPTFPPLDPSGSQAAATGWPTIPGYDILKRLGEGGMGTVYQARHRALNRLVALKMIRADRQGKPEHRARFRAEAEAVAQIRHPNIIQIYDIGEVAGQPFVALELLDGGGLNDRIAGTPQPVRQAAELLTSLVRAVQVAHQAGIVHRDLKPSNVLFAADGTPKITDFGLAKRIDSDAGQTESGQIMGSPSYMAPEQARGQSRNVGPPADIYALGTILYELLTGRPPFKGETTMETLRQVTDDEPAAPSRLVPRLPRDLETICLKCLRKEPARRYHSAQAMGEDLERYLRGEPIKARRTPSWERGAKWARRRPLAATLWILASLLLFGGIFSLFAYQRYLLHRSWTISAHVSEGYGWLHKADSAQTDPELNKIQVGLSALLPRLEAFVGDPQIKQVSDLLSARAREVESLIVARRSDQAARERRQAERDQFQQFRDLRNEAYIHDTQLTGLDLPNNVEAVRGAAQAALHLYAAPGSSDSWALSSWPASLTLAEREEVTDGCYELFLVIADAEPEGEMGLRHLAQAARLRRLPTAAYHLRRASCLARAGRAKEAEQARHDAASLKPVTASDHFLIGQERFKRGDLSTAIQHFSVALQLRPDHFWAQCLWAIACLQLHHPSEAKAGLTACLRQQPDSAWLYLLRGFASYQFAVRAGALLEKEPTGTAAVLKTVMEFHLSAAASDYGRALALLAQKPNNELRYALLVNRGLLGLERRDFARAAADLEAAIQLEPRQLPAHPALALVYQKQGNFEKAVEQYSRAIALRPDSAELYRGRADVELARQDSTTVQRQRGLRDLEQAIRLEKPDNRVLARDHTNRARLLIGDCHESEALSACDAAIRVARDYEPAHALRLDLLLKLKRHDDIIRSLDPIVAGGKATAAVYELRGLARKEVRDFTGAIEDLTNAMALRPDRSALLRQRGWLYIVSDAPRLASHDFEEAIHLAPATPDAYAGRASARLRLGEYREAITDVEKALGLREPTADLCYKAARVYALSAVAVAADVRKMGSKTVALVASYQDRAAGLLRATLNRTAVADRASCLRRVESDPAFRTLQRRVSSADLAGPAAQAGRPGERLEH